MRPRLVKVFPQLAETPIDYAWGGLTVSPIIGRPMPGASANRSIMRRAIPDGVGLSGVFGKMMAEAIAGGRSRFDIFGRIPHAPFPERPARPPGMTLGMLYYRVKDLLA